MDRKELIIIGIVAVAIVAVAATFLFNPSNDPSYTVIDILGDGVIGDNGTIYVKLTDGNKNSLSGKTIHIKIVDKNGTVVYSQDTKTHATGVAIFKPGNLTPGEYTIEASFDGDGNHSKSSVSEKLTVKAGYVEEDVDNSTFTDNGQTSSSTATSQSSSSQSYSSDSYSQSSDNSQSSDSQSQDNSQDSDDGNPDQVIDENGNEVDNVIDENGNQVDPTQSET